MIRFLLRLLRWERDAKAIAHGRVPNRIWNRGVSRVGRHFMRKLYR